ncbi:hypothetical protein [Nostoc sp. NMS7]|uniref:hypothetical protein n=1 Tax=Nostoc sp. NMS7 TaxID=2815391 RepID=UPI0025FDD757|nr:hypothetical protein [Nostoc sp. NMS7]
MGTWQGRYQNLELPWLRWWDNQGNLLQIGWERCLRWSLSFVVLLRISKLHAASRREVRATPTQRLAAKLRELNINPDELV